MISVIGFPPGATWVEASEFVGLLGEPVGEVVGDLMRLILVQPWVDHKVGKVSAIDPARHVVPGRDGQKARVSSLKPTVL